MRELQRQRRIENAHLAVQVIPLVNREQVTSQSRLQKEVEPLRFVKSRCQPDYEGTLGHPQHVLLVDHALLLLSLHDVSFGQRLQCKNVVGQRAPAKSHRAKAAAANEADLLQRSELVLDQGFGTEAMPHLVLLHNAEEMLAIQCQHSDLGTGRHDGRGPWLVVQQRTLAEEVAWQKLSDLLSIHENRDLAIVEDVEGISFLSLLDDGLTLVECHLNQMVGQQFLVRCP
eukprot:CAMPEP_0181463348 /NCGR_PEP_ID=MMETSP1110-20121109/34868_1 /TAXON_ID=174948 /ORGANISM="Symbiodinium sp., Strain CCMP421" /LENGTH=228 /DNA_ID=CAMNT_0023588043 /DNA_START=177 /DNA_END=860 /DNA_ORIENTATION=-